MLNKARLGSSARLGLYSRKTAALLIWRHWIDFQAGAQQLSRRTVMSWVIAVRSVVKSLAKSLALSILARSMVALLVTSQRHFVNPARTGR